MNAYYYALALGAVLMAVSVALKRADDRRCAFANVTDES